LLICTPSLLEAQEKQDAIKRSNRMLLSFLKLKPVTLGLLASVKAIPNFLEVV
jgi:hypothetical protein